MQERVWRYIQEHHMIETGDRIVAGISGGADSVALFYLLLEYQKQIGFDWCAVHVNHNLRGEEAARDEEFVRKLCARYQVEYSCYSMDVAAMAGKLGISTEEAGRLARLDAFQKQMEQWQGNKIALAHHKNDAAETMLHHLCRGTGLKGLCGIYPVQQEKIRPLLCLERSEIEHYLGERQADYVDDSTNSENDYTRNRIRHLVLEPMVSHVNSRTVAHMARTAEHLQRAQEYLERQARDFLMQCSECCGQSEDRDNGLLLKETFCRGERILQEYAVIQAVEQVAGTRKDLTDYHIGRILELVSARTGKSVELPGRCRARRTYEGLIIERVHDCKSSSTFESGDLMIPGEMSLPHGTIKCRIFSNRGQEIPEKRYTKWLNYDKIDEILQIRRRKRGDYLIINASGGRKKIKDYFIDCKIPREIRDEIPLLCMGQEVLWVVGYRIGESWKVDAHTKEILEITYEGGVTNG